MRYPSLYQVNTRVYLQELGQTHGRRFTLADWPEEQLDWLREQDFDWLWPLGVWQTGPAGIEVSRTNAAWLAGFREVLHDLSERDITGSPYAVRQYNVHDDFGGNDALAQLRERLQEHGLRLMLDFVPNHTALDHPWVQEHPEYYIQGSESDLARQPGNFRRVHTNQGQKILAHGRDPYFPGWPDAMQLNYRNPATRAAMIGEMLKIADRCDGVRCDMAMLLLPDVIHQTWGDLSRPADGSEPVDVPFWPEAIARVRSMHPSFQFLAEVYWDREWQMLQQGFHYTYDKRLYDRLHAAVAGPVRDHLGAGLEYQDRQARFLENHDEPRAASAFPLPIHLASALATFTTPGMRFFHEGQLEGRRVHVSIHLGRRPPERPDPILTEFYRRLLECLKRPELREGLWTLRHCRPAWDGNPTWQNFLAWTWQSQDTLPLLACINFGPTPGAVLCGTAPGRAARPEPGPVGFDGLGPVRPPRRRPGQSRSLHGRAALALPSLCHAVAEQGRRRTMRISFDIDDTLVCGPHVPTEQFVPWVWRWWYPERVRQGTRELMKSLVQLGCQLWVYTTSHREPRYLRGWFRSFGIRLHDVVNQDRHEQVVGRQGPSKYPPAFAIDLHIDDSQGVAKEGQTYGFSVLVVRPEDPEWARQILSAVASRK